MRLKRAVVAALVLACLALPGTAAAGTTTVTFDDLTNPNRVLSGQYPTGVIDWGSNIWWLAGPWGQFTTNSISFNTSSQTSAPFTFVSPQRLLQLDAYNGGTSASTITLTCGGQTTRSQSVAANTRVTIATNWAGTCSTVTIGSTNGWNTNFDNLIFDNGLGPLITAVQATNGSSHSTETVTWTTNVAATSQVEYGLTTSYGSLTPLDSTLVTAHSAGLSGLQASTLYHYRVRSSDSLGNLSMSADNVFTTSSAFCDPPITNPIACENSLTGTPPSVWDIPTQDAGDPSIQGFASDISYAVGATANFKISTPASAYSIVIYRIGYYQGNGARQIATVTPSARLPQSQPACLINSTTGLIDCGNWAVSASWTIPTNAVSGVYIAKLTRTDTGGTSHIIFVVRDDASAAPALFQTSDTTWQAYNSYGGNSLYVGGPLTNPARAAKVSYNRPFNTRTLINGLGPYSFFWDSEYPMVRWLESNGYNVTYASAVDTQRRGATAIQNHRVFMSVGHDEYWSSGSRANLETARGAGVNLAFFSGNQTFWKTRWENSIDGTNTPYRTLVSYKETHANAVIDPADPPTWTGTWRDPRFSPPADGGQPENALAGPLFMVNGYRTDTITVTSAFSGLRFWRNTAIAQLVAGGSVRLAPGSLGYEWDEDVDNGFRPAGLIDLSSTIVTVSSLLADYGSTFGTGPATHSLTLYRAPSGALVFGAGFTRWAWGLDATHDTSGPGADPNMQQATVNLLADMGVQPATLQSGLVAATPSTDTTAPSSSITSPANGATLTAGVAVTIRGSATDTGGVVGGIEVSVDGGTSWHRAAGTTSWSYTWTPSGNGQVSIRSRATDDSANVEMPSAGVTVTIGSGGGGATSTPTPTPTSTPTPSGPTSTPTATPVSTPVTCPCTIWPSTARPTNASSSDTNAVELGVKFQSSNAGYITALRFYKGTNNTGTHVGNLWTNSGTLLASKTFTNETASGWQQVIFTSPVAISADTTYVASYHTNVGHYAGDQNYFSTTGVSSPPLQALSGPASGGNGVYIYGANSAFPTNTFNATNYWVDVVYTTSTAIGTPTPDATATPTSTPTATPTPLPGSQTITFDDLSNPNRVLNGQYPTGLIDWGSNTWWLAGPWSQFTTNSISFNGVGQTSAPVTFLSPRRLVRLQAYNGGTVSTTITLACAGQPTVITPVGVGQLVSIATNWTATCSSVTIGSSNGWDTNFDNLSIDTGP
jgi:hypothetical protein